MRGTRFVSITPALRRPLLGDDYVIGSHPRFAKLRQLAEPSGIVRLASALECAHRPRMRWRAGSRTKVANLLLRVTPPSLMVGLGDYPACVGDWLQISRDLDFAEKHAVMGSELFTRWLESVKVESSPKTYQRYEGVTSGNRNSTGDRKPSSSRRSLVDRLQPKPSRCRNVPCFSGGLWGILGAFLCVRLTTILVIILANFQSTRWVSILSPKPGIRRENREIQQPKADMRP